MDKTDKKAWDDKFASDVSDLVDQAKLYRDQLSADRIRAQRYENGDMEADMPSKAGWSAVVSRDVSATLKKVFPSLTRTILGNEIIAEYVGQNEDDQEGAEQVTDFINLVALPESQGRKGISDAMHDACLLRNGILYAGIEDKIVVTGSTHRGLDEFALAELLEDPDTELIEGRAYEAPPSEEIDAAQPSPGGITASPDPAMAAPLQDPAPNPEIMPPQPGMAPPGMPEQIAPEEPAMLYDVKIKRVVKKAKPVLLGVPPEEFLIHPDATDAQVDSPIVGREMRMSRSDLIAMGYDKELVMSLPAESYIDSDGSKFTRRNRAWMQSSPDQKELEMVLYYDLYVRLDYDDDGIAELRHVCAAGDLIDQHILVNDYADFIRYFDIVIERRPHCWEGVSIADDVIEIQKVKTALLRYAMDNTYNVVSPQKAVNIKALANPNNLDAIMNPEPGRPIFMSMNGDARVEDAISYDVQPYVADKAMVAVQYWDKQIVDRTGIDDSSAGLPPDALQNVTAKASAMIEQKGIAQTELMVATIAACLKPVFAAFLKLTIQCNDKARTIRLRDKFVQIDPKTWDADMDVNVNTGLGAGTRERDMMVMGQIMNLQGALFDRLGGLSPILKADNIYNALEKSVQAAGIKSVGKFFTKPDPNEVAAAEKAAAEKPSPEMEKVKAQIMLLGEQSRANAAKEQAQAQADIIVTNAKAKADMMLDAAEKTKNEALEFRQQMLDRYKIDEANKLGRQQIASNERIARHKIKADIEKAHAGELSKSVLGIKEDQEEKAEKPKKEKPSKTVTNFKRDPTTGDLIGMETVGASF
ncbi:MAG: phage portal protein [Aestuariivirga sp.]